MQTKQQKNLIKDIEYVKTVYLQLIKILPSFDITNKSVLPYGLKPHTRSVSWLVEQVITQQTKYNKVQLSLKEVNFDMADTCLHDCIIENSNKKYYINIKIHNADGKDNKNDISAVEKIYMQYKENKDYNIIYVCLGVHFKDINISFDGNYLEAFTAQFLPIYINSRNDKIQAFYKHKSVYRTREEFLKELRKNSKSIILGK